jgi:EAL domain-containing protein (putative c-di-GMP-specific phosphodiesterase class I)
MRVAAASFGLITASAILVHLWNGVIEAHFHFFVMIGVLTLYQDWMAFGIAIGYVVLHHGLVGVLAPEQVYDHPEAIAHPWRWAMIHGAFVLAASAAHVVAWRTNENQLLRDPLTGLPSRLLVQQPRRAGPRPPPAPPRQPRRRALPRSRSLQGHQRQPRACGGRQADRRGRRAPAPRAAPARDGLPLRRRRVRDPLEDIRDEQDAIAVCERILKAFSTPFQLTHGEAVTSASLGVALAADPDQDVGNLIRDADAAMYRAKEAGGGRLMLFDEVTRQRALTRLHTETALRRAIEREEFRVYFQPEVSVESGRIVGVEALVRWEHPERGLVGPDAFIALAEETGLIVPIGTWVLNEACTLARRWQVERLGGDPLVVRVNVSARQLAADDLVDVVAAALERSGVDPEHLCLEVTESVLVEDPDASARKLAALKAVGVKIAVDDFGTGYSSLEYLRRFPVDCVKIDRSFVRGIPHSSEDVAIVNAVIDLGHALGLSVTAEGVETDEQLDRLQSNGCDTAQGFLFSRPEHPDVVERLLR